MEENVFDSIEAIDKQLDLEFGTNQNVDETPEVDTNESQETTDTNVEENTSNEEVAQNDETEEVSNPEVEEPAEDKKSHAFAELRSENTSLKKERDGYKADSDYLKELAASYGYDDVSKFQDAIREARYQKEAQDKGYDPVLYKRLMEQERKIEQLEEKEAQALQDRKLDRLQKAIDEAISDYGVDAQTIFARLDQLGISPDSILNLEAPRVLIDGVMKEEIKNSGKQSQIKDLQNLEGLAEDKNEQVNSIKTITIDSLLKEDLANYKKDNFFE